MTSTIVRRAGVLASLLVAALTSGCAVYTVPGPPVFQERRPVYVERVDVVRYHEVRPHRHGPTWAPVHPRRAETYRPHFPEARGPTFRYYPPRRIR
ncbi:hypothetical protein D3C71_18660 [compost metagenome]